MCDEPGVQAEAGMPRSEEAKLIARARRGHAESFRALVDAYKERLFAFVYRTVRNHHEAEDVCQSAFVKAYESLDSYSETYAFSTWLFTIAYRLCLNGLRKKKAIAADLDFGQLAGFSEDAANELATSEEGRRLKELVWGAVDQLTESQKAAVILFYRENKSCQEIGTVLGIPDVTVKSHLHRAREKLRAVLGEALVEDWAVLEPRRLKLG